MKARIAGAGWVTPLGTEIHVVWQKIKGGIRAEDSELTHPVHARKLLVRRVPIDALEGVDRIPRLRRSSALSHFAVAAARAAIADAGLTDRLPAATAVIFGVSNGGVIYTRRFFDQIAQSGANTASPMLFPETVYNAPASHLCSVLGADLECYTLVGDNSVGLSAVHLGSQLLAMGECDCAVVVGCEEVDWVVCEAFRDWRLSRVPLAEGAGALVLTRDTGLHLSMATPRSFTRRSRAAAAFRDSLRTLEQADADLVISGSCGNFADSIEAQELATLGFPVGLPIKKSLGEAPGASVLWQFTAAVAAVREGAATRILVPAIGFNQQAGGAIVSA